MQPTRIFDLLDYSVTNYGSKDDVIAGKENNKWVKYSAEQYKTNATNFAYGLIKQGFKKGDKIATISNNRPEWNFIDMGINMCGAIHTPIYPTITSEEFDYILRHSDATMLIVSDKFLYKKLKPIVDNIPEIEDLYTIDEVKDTKNWSEILNLGKENAKNLEAELENRKKSIDKNDLATIIYTSGTTSHPKGVMLSHENFIYQCRNLDKIVELGPEHRALSFLPLCHVLERVVNYTYTYLGISIYYAEGFQKLADNIRDVQPHTFATVPRIIERVYDRIIAKGKQLDGFKKKLFFWANKLATEYEIEGKNVLYKSKLALVDSLVFSQWRKALGGRVEFVISGGAALQPRLAKVFWAAGMPIREGYGLTETAPVIAFNRAKPDIKIGTVGIKIGDEQQIKIADDGEILFKGPNLMLGYYKNEKLTNEAIDKEGWFHTGDVGVILEEKFLKITDRKKEIFKLSTGKYIAPQPIENLFKESVFVEQMMVVGENEKFPGAIISPNFEILHHWATENKINYRENEDLVKKPEVIKKYKQEIISINKKLGQVERINTFKLVCQEWTPATGELSPTLKKRRKFIANKYQKQIIDMFAKK